MAAMPSQHLQAVQGGLDAYCSAGATASRANLRLPQLVPTLGEAAGVVPHATAGGQAVGHLTTQHQQVQASTSGQFGLSAVPGFSNTSPASSSAPPQHPQALPALALVHPLSASRQGTARSGAAAPEMQLVPPTPAIAPAMLAPVSVDASAEQRTPEGAAVVTGPPAAIADDVFQQQVQLFDVFYNDETWHVEDELRSILDMAEIHGNEADTALQQSLARTRAGRQANAAAALDEINAAESNRVLSSYLSDPFDLEMQQLLLAAAATDQQEQQYIADMALALGL